MVSKIHELEIKQVVTIQEPNHTRNIQTQQNKSMACNIHHS